MLQDFSFSHLHILGFKINPLSYVPFSINSFHSDLHLSLFQRYLLLQTLASNIRFHVQI